MNEHVIGVIFLVLSIISIPVIGPDLGVIALAWVIGVPLIFVNDDEKEVNGRKFHRSYEEFEAENWRRWC